ncbi:hypothetical protein B0T25DRAFT_542439 [Lasiosphaeria hispida]|uniref:Uncharacterized protein n=1 Tax=Lasiosphaeria hispida TaxID=260671 RepID=A0AAJ0HHN3_9PEZI|nr:hypothetical protein B0T25DRAFT_542439 [Lasiosphaeria hispida]
MPATAATVTAATVTAISERRRAPWAAPWRKCHGFRLKADDTELVRSYMKTLEKELGGETGEPSAADLSAKLKNPTNRQINIRDLVQGDDSNGWKPL